MPEGLLLYRVDFNIYWMLEGLLCSLAVAGAVVSAFALDRHTSLGAHIEFVLFNYYTTLDLCWGEIEVILLGSDDGFWRAAASFLSLLGTSLK